jgi:hypothetical protein
MKAQHTHLTVIAVALLAVRAAHAQTNFVDHVSGLWLAGHKSNVLAIANARLAQNTNDIAGLLLKMEYEEEFLQLSQVSNTIDRVIQVGGTITLPKFSTQYPFLTDSLIYMKNLIPLYPQDELLADQGKEVITGKPLSVKPFLQALQDDDYFQ